MCCFSGVPVNAPHDDEYTRQVNTPWLAVHSGVNAPRADE